MEIKSKKILVTGGAGFIGSNLVDELIKQNNKVVVIDDLSSGKKESINLKAKFYKVDVRSKKIAEIFKKENPQIIFHLAAKPIVQEVYKNPYEAIEVNVMGTVNVLEACRKQYPSGHKQNIESIVIVSSDKAYGKAEKLPYTEITPLKGDHPYDVSKSAADLIARAYFVTYGLPIAITRFSNVFGPGDTNFSRIIPGVFEAVINKKQFLVRSDGKMIREYTYVKDIVVGCIKLAGSKNFGEAFNFGSNNIFNVIEVIKNIENVLNIKVDYKILNTAKNEIPAQYLDWSKVKKILNWHPETTFKNGIEETFNWYKINKLK